MKKRFWLVGLILLIIGLVMAVVDYIDDKEMEILNPLSGQSRLIKKNNYRVVAFLPPWMINKVKKIDKGIDDLIFLGVEVEENGSLKWDFQSKKIWSDKYLSMKKNIKKRGGKNILGLKLFDDNKLNNFFGSEKNQNKFLSEVKELVSNGNFDGVNLDFEYQGNPMAILEREVLSLVKQLRELDVGEISLDVFCNTVIRGQKEDLERLINELDWLMIMAYDFHRPGTTRTGSVAPLKSDLGKRDIWEVFNKISDLKIDKKKTVMIYPLYGYEWKTVGEKMNAVVKGKWWQMASYGRIKKELKQFRDKLYDLRQVDCDGFRPLKEGEAKLCFDELSLTPWLVFKRDGEIRQIYYDDLNSLEIKVQVVKDLNWGGVAFWALGYEGESGEVWKMVERVLR
ncbi:hypothetical protein DRH14_00040 [Candidatus Shapirobacteria bacterium]|nr:MAG: hypothetical protein DRH14_00040 [Candidatus Shapirobacteria bacterium]